MGIHEKRLLTYNRDPVGILKMKEHQEYQRRLEKKISSYSGAFMSNAKWKKVLDVLGAVRIPVQFAFVFDERFRPQTLFPVDGYEKDYTKDCTFHGPFNFREIYAIKCPRYEMQIDSKTGAKHQDETRFNLFIEKLTSTGKFDLEYCDEGVILYAYKK